MRSTVPGLDITSDVCNGPIITGTVIGIGGVDGDEIYNIRAGRHDEAE